VDPAELYQTFQELVPILLKPFHKIKREGILDSVCEATITLINKTGQGHNQELKP
jgi:hypothetical protein